MEGAGTALEHLLGGAETPRRFGPFHRYEANFLQRNPKLARGAGRIIFRPCYHSGTCWS
jgi:hypothetical protein